MSDKITYGGAWLKYGGYVLNIDSAPIQPNTYRFRFDEPQTTSSLTGVGAYGSWNRISDTVWDFTCESGNAGYYNFSRNMSAELPSCSIIGSDNTVFHLSQTFYGQTNLKSIYMHNVDNDAEPFSGCDNLTDVQFDTMVGGYRLTIPAAENVVVGTLGGNVHELVMPKCKSLRIGHYVHDGQSNLLQYVGYTPSFPPSFAFCDVVIEDLTGTTSIYHLAFDGTGISTLYLGGTSTVTDAQQACEQCDHMTQVYIEDLSHVTNAWAIFRNCSMLSSVQDFDLSSCANMADMFYGCTSLTACPDFTVHTGVLAQAGYRAVRNMYSQCTSLTGGAFDWYYKMTGDYNAYINAYGYPPPDPSYEGPFRTTDDPHTFYGAQSTEVGWPYININWR